MDQSGLIDSMTASLAPFEHTTWDGVGQVGTVTYGEARSLPDLKPEFARGDVVLVQKGSHNTVFDHIGIVLSQSIYESVMYEVLVGTEKVILNANRVMRY